MNTYMVEVNNKFMVRIEIEGSACAAEHFFLDGYNGVWGALAFDQKAMKTDCFIGCMMHDELTTVDALCEKLKKLDDADCELARIASKVRDFEDRIEKLTKEKEQLEEEYANELVHHKKLEERLNAVRPQ